MFCRMVYKSGQIFPPFCHNTRCDRQTDRQTDGQTEFSSQYRVCITCSTVKTTTQDYDLLCDLVGLIITLMPIIKKQAACRSFLILQLRHVFAVLYIVCVNRDRCTSFLCSDVKCFAVFSSHLVLYVLWTQAP